MYSFVDIHIIILVCTAVFDTFQSLSCDVLSGIIHKLNRTNCGLDPFPTKVLMSHLSYIINIILRIVNLDRMLEIKLLLLYLIWYRIIYVN